MSQFLNIKRVCVIGGGPAGVAAAKYLEAEHCFDCIDVFEQRPKVGGVWNYTPENDSEESFNVPQTSPHVLVECPIWRTVERKHPTFISPLYERLEANLPKGIMCHSGLEFPESSQLFPKHDDIEQYLERYAKDTTHLIKFETQVLEVTPCDQHLSQKWHVVTKNLVSGWRKEATYDAIVVANGHYSVPFVPDIKAIADWNKDYPSTISHSKTYRRPEDFQGKKTLVIGGGYSALDVALQVEHVCKAPLFWSVRNPVFRDRSTETLKCHSEPTEFLPSTTHTRAIRFADGHMESDYDAVIVCTGYLYSFPFLPEGLSPPVVTKGERTLNVYQQVFYNADPTLAFLALPQKVVPFPIAEVQAAVVARVFSGRLVLPDREVMLRWEQAMVKQKGDSKQFHYLNTPDDGHYLNMMHSWAMKAAPMAKGVTNTSSGKMPPHWTEKDFWVRQRIMPMKMRYHALGEKRHSIKTIEELGYSFEEWKRTDGAHGDGDGDFGSSNAHENDLEL